MDVTCLVQETALQKRAPLTIPAMTDCQILSETLESTTFQYRNFAYTLHMPGRHQVYNALTAIEVIRFLGMHGFLISAAQIQQAFGKVQVPARTQILQREPLILLDGGHNQAGVSALCDLLKHAGKHPIHGICGMITTKDYHTACNILRETLDTVFCVDDFLPSAVPAEALAACFEGYADAKAAPDFETALREASAMQFRMAEWSSSAVRSIWQAKHCKTMGFSPRTIPCYNRYHYKAKRTAVISQRCAFLYRFQHSQSNQLNLLCLNGQFPQCALILMLCHENVQLIDAIFLIQFVHQHCARSGSSSQVPSFAWCR